MKANGSDWVEGFATYALAQGVAPEAVPVLLKAAAFRRLGQDPNFAAGAGAVMEAAGIDKTAANWARILGRAFTGKGVAGKAIATGVIGTGAYHVGKGALTGVDRLRQGISPGYRQKRETQEWTEADLLKKRIEAQQKADFEAYRNGMAVPGGSTSAPRAPNRWLYNG